MYYPTLLFLTKLLTILKIMKRSFLFILLLLVVSVSVAQSGRYKTKTSRKNKALVDFRQYRYGGWMFAPGLTYMWAHELDSLSDVVKDNLKQRGRLAVYLEAGRYQIFWEGGYIFNYLDYSIAYKRLSGIEKYYDQKAVFKQNYILGNFNINNVIQISDYTFIQNSLGVNLDYNLFPKYKAPGGYPFTDQTNRLIFSLHYKIGFGIKATERLFIIPSLETPILNISEWENGRSSYGIFTSRYRPLILSVRFAWLRTPDRNSCPPVYGPEGDRNKDKQHRMG